VLLILLLGKYLENCHVPSGEHMRSSHFFLPLASNTGLEEKSSSHMADCGGPVLISALSSFPEGASSGELVASATLLVSAAARIDRTDPLKPPVDLLKLLGLV
jgi:hypothetical protein